MYSFIHTSDWHIGKPFGRYGEDLRGRLREARHTLIERIAAVARKRQAPLVVVAGDVWDSPEPATAVFTQALNAMGSHEGLQWALLPGNHDLLIDGGRWDRLADDQNRPDNVILLLREEPVEIESGCSCCRRRAGGKSPAGT